MNPKATFYMANGNKIVVELLPDAAPNTVASFVSCVLTGALDGHNIERVVAGKWVDFSYTAFHSDNCRYLIPREADLNPEIEPLDSHPGCVPFFPLKDCPEHKGIYPVFGKVVEGMDEIWRLEKVETTPVQTAIEGYVVDTPVEKQTIEKVTIELNGYAVPEVVKMEHDWLPPTWK